MTVALDYEGARSRLDLMRWLLRAGGLHDTAEKVADDWPVFPLDDGAMGSFALEPSPNGGHAFVEATYDDDDGIEVLITLFVDGNGQPLQVDFWKVDFAPLLSFPSQNQLRAVKPA